MTTSASDPPAGLRRHSDVSPDFLGAAIDWMPVGVVVAGSDGLIVAVNREIERLFGYAAGELLGQPVDLLVPEDLREGHFGLRRAFGEQPQARLMGAGRELFGRRKDGSEVRIEIGLTPLRIRDGLLVIASVIDVTDRPGIRAGAHTPADDGIEFERLVGELGAEFVNLRPEEVDRAIEDALSRMVRTLGLDRSALFQVDPTGDFVHTHQWTRPGWAPPLSRTSAREQFPWLLAQVQAGALVAFASIDEVPNEIDREHLGRLGTKSSVVVPLMVGGQAWGALTFAAVREPRTWTPGLINRLRVVAHIFANAIARRLGDERLRTLVDELSGLRDRLREENRYLREELKMLTGAPAIVGHSRALRRVLEQVRQVAPTNSTVLLLGETGTGKALLAPRIPELSARAERAMVRVNCASLSVGWVEGELVGAVYGSLSNGEPRHVGRLELANGSTVLLDEVADMPLEAQAGLIRVLQDNEIQPHGGGRPMKVDIRVIATTRKDLKRAIKDGTFRDDLYYRLNVFPIHVPPLRERREDIPLLVWRFVDEFSAALGKPIDAIDQESMAALQEHEWPGNARELRNVVERAMIVPAGRRLHIPLPHAAATNGSGSVRRRARRPAQHQRA